MAFSKAFIASLFLSFLLFHLTAANQKMDINGSNSPAPQPSPIDCVKACDGRCAETKRPNLCKRACGSCCHKCNCVPPGTYGNYEFCPCYRNIIIHGVHKCP